MNPSSTVLELVQDLKSLEYKVEKLRFEINHIKEELAALRRRVVSLEDIAHLL